MLYRLGTTWGNGAGLAVLSGIVTLASCGDRSTHRNSVGGTVTGLTGTGLVLQINGTDDQAISARGAFSFSTRLADGVAYKVTVLSEPSNPVQNCVVMNGTGSGSLAHSDVTSVAVRCANVGRFAYSNSVGFDGIGVKLLGFPPTFISGYFIDAVSGALRPVPGGPVVLGQKWAEGFAIDPSGKFAFAATQAAHGMFFSLVSNFLIEQTTGALTGGNNNELPLPSQCCELNLKVIVDPLGRFLFVLADIGIFVFKIDAATGAPTAVAGSPFPFFAPTPNYLPRPVAIDNNGKYLYVGRGGTTAPAYIDAYRIDQKSGALSPVPGSPFPAGPTIRLIVIDPTGQFVYVTSDPKSPATPPSVSAYKLVDSTGALSQIVGSPFAVGSSGSYVVSLTLHPSDAFAYVLESSGAVTTYAVDPQTGALHDGVAALPAYSTSSNPGGVIGPYLEAAAADPSGKFLFLSNEGPYDYEVGQFIPNNITIFAIDPNTGALAQIADSPFYAPNVGNYTRVGIFVAK